MRSVSWLAGHCARSAFPDLGPVALEANATAYSCGGSYGFGSKTRFSPYSHVLHSLHRAEHRHQILSKRGNGTGVNSPQERRSKRARSENRNWIRLEAKRPPFPAAFRFQRALERIMRRRGDSLRRPSRRDRATGRGSENPVRAAFPRTPCRRSCGAFLRPVLRPGRT